jgi:hypothetical protein
MRTFYALLADLILVTHGLIVLFNVAALPVIWLAHFRHWRLARNFGFRITHLLLIALVFAESVLGITCPLTTWEDLLRTKAGADPQYAGGFIAHWVRQLIFYDLDPRFFTIGYTVFLILVLATLIWIRPRPPRWLKTSGSQGDVR